MSWVVASVVSSTSDTVMPDRRSYQPSPGPKGPGLRTARSVGRVLLDPPHRPSGRGTCQHERQRQGQHPSEHADGTARPVLLVIEGLADGDDHRQQHPDRRHDEGRNRHAGNEAEDPYQPRRRGEADRPHQLAHIDRRLRLRQQPRRRSRRSAAPSTPRPSGPAMLKNAMFGDGVLVEAAGADTGGQARQDDDDRRPGRRPWDPPRPLHKSPCRARPPRGAAGENCWPDGCWSFRPMLLRKWHLLCFEADVRGPHGVFDVDRVRS